MGETGLEAPGFLICLYIATASAASQPCPVTCQVAMIEAGHRKMLGRSS
jgi:hypothetical protein